MMSMRCVHLPALSLTDLQALDAMLISGQIENGVRRIGAEQEECS